MKLFRFELAFDGWPQDIGFLQGLDDVGLWSVVTNDLYSLFDALPICELDADEPVSFWFTEYGLERFEDAINRVIDELSAVNWQLLGSSMEVDLEDAIYKDEYQAAFSRECIFGKCTEYVEVDDVCKFRNSV